MLPYLRGSGEDTGWLSIKLSCGDSCGRHTGATVGGFSSVCLKTLTSIQIKRDCTHQNVTFYAHLHEDAWPLSGGEWHSLHEVRDVPVREKT